MKIFILIQAGISLVFSCYAASGASASYQADAAENTIALINHINYVVQTIETYNNCLVLEQEYKNISVGNINLNKIPDEEVLKLVTDILGVLNDMRMDERKRARALQLFERGLSDKKVDCLIDTAQNAIDAQKNYSGSGVPGLEVADVYGRVLTLAKSCIVGTIDSYLTYAKFRRDARNEWNNTEYELDTEKLKRLHELNILLLQSEWSLVTKYSLDDRFRITGENVVRLVECLKDDNRRRIYRRLKPMATVFEIYPTYWYYRSLLAVEFEDYEDAAKSAEHFFKVNRGLFRKDAMAAAVAMSSVTAMLATDQVDKDVIRDRLELICRQNYASDDAELGIFCASVYHSVLDDDTSALEILDAIKDTLEMSSEDKLVEYRSLVSDKNVSHRTVRPNSFDLARCRMLRIEIDQKRKGKIDVSKLKAVCERKTTASMEKLFYFGHLRLKDMWSYVSKDVSMINVYCNKSGGKVSNVVVEVPLRWFLLGEMKLELTLLVNDGDSEKYTVESSELPTVLASSIFETDTDETPYVRWKVMLNGVNDIPDGVRLCLNHKTLPVEMVFSKNDNSDNRSGGCAYYPSRVMKFMGKLVTQDWLIEKRSMVHPPKYDQVVQEEGKVKAFKEQIEAQWKKNATETALRDFIIQEFKEIEDYDTVWVGSNIPNDILKKAMSKLDLTINRGVLVLYYVHRTFNPDSVMILTTHGVYFTAEPKGLHVGVIGKNGGAFGFESAYCSYSQVEVVEKNTLFFKSFGFSGEIYGKEKRSKWEIPHTYIMGDPPNCRKFRNVIPVKIQKVINLVKGK